MAQVQRWWRRLDVAGTEEFTQDGHTFEGRVQVQETAPWSAEYRVTFDQDWVTLVAQVAVVDGEGSRRLELRRDESGFWFANGREVEPCRDAIDVDLGMTPSTNTSVIRRLKLPVEGTAELTAAWVRFPGLTVEPLRQRYTRVSAHGYLYESLREAGVVFQARIDVDSSNLVERYARLFERVNGPG
jgi:uncharacterized protein